MMTSPNAFQIFETSTSDENLYTTAQAKSHSWFWEDDCEVFIFGDRSFLTFDRGNQYVKHGDCTPAGIDESLRHCY